MEEKSKNQDVVWKVCRRRKIPREANFADGFWCFVLESSREANLVPGRRTGTHF
jgi:hypothetical protein